MVLGDIGAALLDQRFDHRRHLGNMLGRARLDGWRQAAERRDVFVKLLLGLLRDLADGFVQRQIRKVLCRPRVDLVVHVGDVADIGDMVGAVAVPQQAEQQVEDDDGPRIPNMRVVVDRRAADIHAHVGSIQRLERLFLTTERVVKRKRH